jgi:hypothetical protein
MAMEISLKLGNRQPEPAQQGAKRVVERALARRLARLDQPARPRAPVEQTTELRRRRIAIAARLVDDADQLRIGQTRGDLGDRTRHAGDAVPWTTRMSARVSVSERCGRIPGRRCCIADTTSGIAGHRRSPSSAAAES